MPQPRASSTQWPSAGDMRTSVQVQTSTIVTDAMGGRTETWADFGSAWKVKLSTLAVVVSEEQSAITYQCEGRYWPDLWTQYRAGIGIRLLVGDLTLKLIQLENPAMVNRTLVAYCAEAVNTQ